MQGTVGEWKRCNYDLPYAEDIKSSIKYHLSVTSSGGYRALVYRWCSPGAPTLFCRLQSSIKLNNTLLCFMWPSHLQWWSWHANTICGDKSMDKISQLLRHWQLEILACRWPSCRVSKLATVTTLSCNVISKKKNYHSWFWLVLGPLLNRYATTYSNNLTFVTVKVKFFLQTRNSYSEKSEGHVWCRDALIYIFSLLFYVGCWSHSCRV